MLTIARKAALFSRHHISGLAAKFATELVISTLRGVTPGGEVRAPVRSLLLAFLFTAFAQTMLRAETPVHDKDRIVFCGDSITGLGGNGGANGWIGLISEGLNLAHPADTHTLTALGQSGAQLAGWQNTEKKSRDEAVYLDVKGVDVKATLDGGAEVVVIMLGMNDLLRPAVKDAPADFDAWAMHYRELTEAIKARTHPRVIALATITPCTEDLGSPRNRVEGELNTRLAAVAKDENAIILPTHEAMVEFLAMGRSYKPDFHVTIDFVHPNPAGHLAIAVGMLRGLGENDAARQLLNKHASLLRPSDAELPALSYTLAPQAGSPDEAARHFTVHYQWTAPASSTADPVVTPTVPEGWKVSPTTTTGAKGDFQVSGPLDHLVNKITLDAKAGNLAKRAEVDIPAGWRMAWGNSHSLGWTPNSVYDPAKDQLPLDQLLLQDVTYKTPATFPTGETPPWEFYLASINFGGGGKPGCIDMAAVTYAKPGELVYGARWVYSDKDRPVDVTMKLQAWGGNISLTTWINDANFYAGKLLNEPGHQVVRESKLHRGWNRLLFKSTFMTWLWTFSIDLTGKPGDNLADLRYATAPR